MGRSWMAFLRSIRTFGFERQQGFNLTMTFAKRLNARCSLKALRTRYCKSRLFWCFLLLSYGPTTIDADEGTDFFEAKIRPVLSQRCYECHSVEAQRQGKLKGKLLLDTRAGIRNGGESGPAVVPGDVDQSILVAAIRHESFEMPPKGKLGDNLIADFEKWIEMGAPDPRDGTAVVKREEIDIEAGMQFWSLQPLEQPDVPAVKSDWPRSEIDRFIAAKHATEKLQPVADAEPRELVRRVYFDLTGLPPSPQALDEWTTRIAGSQHDFAALVDELLASPQFAERWGRHWLDVARFGESNGGTSDRIWPDAWRYRNYVIDSFHHDKPFDQFLREQLAGDLLPADAEDQRWQQIVASGFWAIGSKPDNATRMEVIGEQLDVMGRAMLGLSIGCARCHDHKYDPIPTRDFYALAGIMQNTAILDGKPFAAFDPELEKSQRSKVKDFERALATATRAIEQATDRLEELASQQSIRCRPGDAWAGLIERFSDAGRKKKAEETLQDLIKAEADLEKLRDAGPPEVRLGVAVKDQAAKGRNWLNAHIHIRGSDSNLGEEVPRGVLQVLLPPETAAPEIGEEESGRLQLADIVSEHPLAARVMVNRIWHHLFGRGVVRSVDNFGTLGEAPTHPELLEHLAVCFVKDDWSVKQTVRRIVLSRTYQLSALEDSQNLAADPENKLLWRHAPRRLDAEALRDAILSASGALDRDRPGRFASYAAVAQMTDTTVADKTHVRAVYLPVARGFTTDILDAFNFPPSDLVVGRREAPSVPTQALFMLNSRLVSDHTQIMARRLARECDDDRQRVERAYRLTMSREPVAVEVDEALDFVAQFRAESEVMDDKAKEQDAWAAFCQTLFASSEFRFLR